MTHPTWQTTDGSVKLWLGDCTKLLPLMPEGSVDAVVTDPPFGIVNGFNDQHNRDGMYRRLNFHWDFDGVTEKVVIPAVKLSLGLCDDKAGCFVSCGADQFGDLLNTVRESGFTAKPAAWVKECPPPAGKGNWWPSGFELAVYGYRSGAYFGDTDPRRSNVFVYDSYRFGQPGKVDHPTQKPLAYVLRVVEAIVPPGGICLDPFAGSGTTGVACVRTGRKFRGIEIEEKYFNIAVKRIEAELNRHPLFEEPTQVQRNFV